MDQSNFPGVAGVAGAADVAVVAGVTAVPPEGAGSAAKTWNAKPRAPAPRLNFKNERFAAENVFDPAFDVREAGKSGNFMQDSPSWFCG
ncbi:MAG TPA: hypothetical protein VF780_05575 [Nitrosospira sp.]